MTIRTSICEVTVATAAPTTSSLGNGPNPRIRIGSRIILPTSPRRFAISGVLESPCAVESPVRVRFKNENRISPQVISVYNFAAV